MSREAKKSKYHNVYWHKRTSRWIVKLHARNNPSGKETVNVEYYLDEIVAAKVADVAAHEVCGPDAKLNFPLVAGQPVPPPGIPRSVIIGRLLSLRAILPRE